VGRITVRNPTSAAITGYGIVCTKPASYNDRNCSQF
jgi:hypothetical protein